MQFTTIMAYTANSNNIIPLSLLQKIRQILERKSSNRFISRNAQTKCSLISFGLRLVSKLGITPNKLYPGNKQTKSFVKKQVYKVIESL